MGGHEEMICPACGHGGHGRVAAPGPSVPSRNLATAALVLNLFVLPGLGTIMAGRDKEGYWQLGLFVLAVVLTIMGLIFALPVVWLWVLFKSVEMVKQAKREHLRMITPGARPW